MRSSMITQNKWRWSVTVWMKAVLTRTASCGVFCEENAFLAYGSLSHLDLALPSLIYRRKLPSTDIFNSSASIKQALMHLLSSISA